jgi:hypothetical protein
MSNKGIINKEIGPNGNTAGTAEIQDRAGEQEAEMKGKSACKSNDITRMLMRGALKDITPSPKENRGEGTERSKEIASSKEAGSCKIFRGRTTSATTIHGGDTIVVVKMRQTTKSGNPGSTKKRDTSDGNKTIG